VAFHSRAPVTVEKRMWSVRLYGRCGYSPHVRHEQWNSSSFRRTFLTSSSKISICNMYVCRWHSHKSGEIHQSCVDKGNIPTKLTTKTATQIATPSVHSCCSRADGTAEPITVDTCNTTHHEQLDSSIRLCGWS
jgi:hypothetical protein